MYDDHEYDVEYFKMRLVNTDTASNVKNPRCIDLEEINDNMYPVWAVIGNILYSEEVHLYRQGILTRLDI